LGIPALFIPGNAGSAKQMRSIAKEASKYYYENLAEGHRDGTTSARPIDFFTGTKLGSGTSCHRCIGTYRISVQGNQKLIYVFPSLNHHS
jgi:hypothetical protein